MAVPNLFHGKLRNTTAALKPTDVTPVREVLEHVLHNLREHQTTHVLCTCQLNRQSCNLKEQARIHCHSDCSDIREIPDTWQKGHAPGAELHFKMQMKVNGYRPL